MGLAACRENDTNSHGGTTSAKSPNVFINGRAAIRQDDAWASHVVGFTTHSAPYITVGSATVRINGKGAGRVGDALSCGATVSTGSPTVNIG